MTTTSLTYDAILSAPAPQSSDLISAHYDASTEEIVVIFWDNKTTRVATQNFEELAAATPTDYEQLDGTRAGVTYLTETIGFAVTASWWREQAS